MFKEEIQVELPAKQRPATLGEFSEAKLVSGRMTLMLEKELWLGCQVEAGLEW